VVDAALDGLVRQALQPSGLLDGQGKNVGAAARTQNVHRRLSFRLNR